MYEKTSAALFIDPWVARDDYIAVVLDRSHPTKQAFFAKHAKRPLFPAERVQALRLLEIQRHLMLMYTSCGWFFDELTGPATVQILQYAGRALQLNQQVSHEDREEAFLQRLQEAWSNIPGFGNGRHVYERFVKPAMLDLVGVAAHYAVSSIFNGHDRNSSIFCYRVTLEQSQILESGKTKFASGVAHLNSDATETSIVVGFGVLHFGDHNVSAGVHPLGDQPWFERFVTQASQAFSAADLPECLRLIDRYFNGSIYSLKSLFHDERTRIINRIVQSTLSDAEALYRRVHEDHAPLMSFLSDLGVPLPPILRLTTEFVLASAVRRALMDPASELEVVRSLLEIAKQGGFNLDAGDLESALRRRLNALVDCWMRSPSNMQALEDVENVIALSRLQPFELNLWKSQNAYYELSQAMHGNGQAGVDEVWLSHFRGLGQWLGIAMPQLPSSVGQMSRDPAA